MTESKENRNMSLWIEKRLLRDIDVKPFILLGCPRRNVLSQRVWRSDVGAAVCALVGRRESVEWEGNPVDFYQAPDGGTLLLWRGGPWRDWWMEDAILLVGMVRAVSNIRATGVYVLHEVDGATRVRYVGTPAREAERVYTDMMVRWRSGALPRIRRDGDRAEATCWRCPVRKKCVAMDIEAGDTSDWM